VNGTIRPPRSQVQRRRAEVIEPKQQSSAGIFPAARQARNNSMEFVYALAETDLEDGRLRETVLPKGVLARLRAGLFFRALQHGCVRRLR
jgi:hypothetical protein